MLPSTWTLSLAGLCVASLLTGCGPTPDASQSSQAGEPAQMSEELFYRDFGTYIVHYNAVATDQISPKIAKEYGITRSPNRAMINISILRKNEGATGTAVSATVEARVTNLTGQLKSVDMRQVTEGESIYYIGEVNVANAETLIINVSATPEGEHQPLSFSYKKQFFDH